MDNLTERNETPVEVTLKTDRIYRAKDSDTTAITVKAGVAAMVPTWVAEAWGILPTPAPDARAEPEPEAPPAIVRPATFAADLPGEGGQGESWPPAGKPTVAKPVMLRQGLRGEAPSGEPSAQVKAPDKAKKG